MLCYFLQYQPPNKHKRVFVVFIFDYYCSSIISILYEKSIVLKTHFYFCEINICNSTPKYGGYTWFHAQLTSYNSLKRGIIAYKTELLSKTPRSGVSFLTVFINFLQILLHYLPVLFWCWFLPVVCFKEFLERHVLVQLSSQFNVLLP